MKKLLTFLALLSSLYSSSCVPLDELYSKEYKICASKALNEYDITRCITTELKQADKELNTAYNDAQKRIQKFRQKDLLNIQRLWIKYTDAKCGFLYHKESGSAGLSSSAECKLQETILRTIELKKIN